MRVYCPITELEAAKKLCRDALASGIMNDLASGSNADLVVITQAGAQILRPYEVIQEKGEHAGIYSYAKGTTRVIETKASFHFLFESLYFGASTSHLFFVTLISVLAFIISDHSSRIS